MAVALGYGDLRAQVDSLHTLAIEKGVAMPKDPARHAIAGHAEHHAPAPFEAFQCQGSVPEVERAVVLRDHGRGVFLCRERIAPDYVGVFQIRLHVASDGSVQASQLGATPPPSSALNQCVVDAVHSIRFPPLSEGGCAVVTAPFIFGADVR
jgi:hypothetical protein